MVGRGLDVWHGWAWGAAFAVVGRGVFDGWRGGDFGASASAGASQSGHAVFPSDGIDRVRIREGRRIVGRQGVIRRRKGVGGIFCGCVEGGLCGSRGGDL